MKTLKALATTVALVASSAAPALATAATGGHGAVAVGAFGRTSRGAAPRDRSSFRSDSRSRFVGGVGGLGFTHTDLGASWGPEHGRRPGQRGRGQGYGYGGYPYVATGYDYGDAPEPGSYEPRGFGEDYARLRRGPATTAAPLAYGSGAHDGAYAYGYNGHAQTPPLP